MAKKRDIIIAAIIAVSFLITVGFFGLVFIGMLSESGDFSLGGFDGRVAVVEIFGDITSSSDTIRQLKKWGKAGSIDAIVLHIDSPGGAIAPSQEIYSEIKRIREEENKIIVASMASVAASGGYLVGCACDRIVANPGTITGSIGVMIQYFTAGELMKKIGVSYETIKSGELKDVGTLDRHLTENERRMLTTMVMDAYEQFVEAIAESREMEMEEVYKVADGSVYSGRHAFDYGLVDTLGGFEDAVRIAADLAGIGDEPEIVREFKPKKGLWDLFVKLNSVADRLLESGSNSPRVMYLY